MAPHQGPHRCTCGELHDEYSVSNDLEPFIQTDGITCLNESVVDACKPIFRPLRRRGDEEHVLCSADDDPELLIHVPFTVAVKISSLIVVGGPAGAPPARVRAFINQEGIDFSDASSMAAVQEWDLADGNTESLEYPTLIAKFQNVYSITLHFTENHAAGESLATCIRYIAFKGEGTANRRGIVDATYEVVPMPDATSLSEALNGQIF